MDHPLFQALNSVVREYNKLPLSQLFLQDTPLEIHQTTKQDILNLIPSYPIPKEDILYLKGRHIYLLKLHSPLPIDNCEELLKNGGIIISRGGQVVVNSFNISGRNLPIQAIILFQDRLVTDGEIETYATLLEPFYGHLSIKLLKYKGGQAMPFRNMFEFLEELPETAYFRILESVPQRYSMRDFSNQMDGSFYQTSVLESCFYICSEAEVSQMDIYFDLLPLINTHIPLKDFSAIKKNYRYLQHDVSLGRYPLVLKSKNTSNSVSFRCLINLKSVNYNAIFAELEVFFKEMSKQLLVMGVGNHRQQLIRSNLEDIKTISKLLQMDQTDLIRRFIL